MIEVDGPIQIIEVPAFTEAPWVFKREDKYYLTYFTEFPEVIDYAMADSSEVCGNIKVGSMILLRIHQQITSISQNTRVNGILFTHNAIIPSGGEFRRSVCIDYLYFNEDCSMNRIIPTVKGADKLTN